MKISIHQPEHLPWLGLLNKIHLSEVFVILDTVQFNRRNFQHRNKIRNPSKDGFAWLTVPFENTGLHTKIIDVKISEKIDWKKKYLEVIKANYINSKYFEYYFTALSDIINKNHTKLAVLNVELLNFILNEFKIETKIVYASKLELPKAEGGNEVILSICKKLEATRYLSGSGGKNYLQEDMFNVAGITIDFIEFHHPQYSQQYSPFLPFMSSIDLLFNHGAKEAQKILFNINTNE